MLLSKPQFLSVDVLVYPGLVNVAVVKVNVVGRNPKSTGSLCTSAILESLTNSFASASVR